MHISQEASHGQRPVTVAASEFEPGMEIDGLREIVVTELAFRCPWCFCLEADLEDDLRERDDGAANAESLRS